MSFYYYNTTPPTIITPEDEVLDERWDIIDLNDTPTKTSSSFEPCHPTYYQFLKSKKDQLYDSDSIQQSTPLSPPGIDTSSQDFISSYFREEIMDNLKTPKTNIENTEDSEICPYYFDTSRNNVMPIIIEEEEEEEEEEGCPDYFDVPRDNDMLVIVEEEEAEEEQEKVDVEDETILLEQVTIQQQHDNVDKYIAPKSLLGYHQNMADYYQSCLVKQVSENELIGNLHHLSIL